MQWVGVPRTLFGKLALVQVSFGALVVVGSFLALEIAHERRHLESSQLQNLELAQDLLHEQLEHARLALDDPAGLRSELRRLAGLNPGVDLYWLDAAGRVIASSVPDPSLRRRAVSLAPLHALLSNGATPPIRGDDPRDPERTRVFSVAALGANATPVAYFYVVLRGADVDLFDRVTGMRGFRESVGFIALAVLLALVTALVIIFGVLRPFREISRSMNAFRRGGFQEWPVPIGGANSGASDLDQLAADFNDMAARIAQLVHRLKDEDQTMREMLASVSHDLRTPLTIVQGQLETLLLKGDGIPERERRQLLEGALGAAKSLGRLVQSVFELARLESPHFRLRMERFSLAEAIHDAAAKFAVRARESGVTVVTEGAERYAMVDGDLALIERVLDNLLDNAFRHARGVDRITLSLAEEAGGVRVTVRDNGEGIPRDRLEALARGDPEIRDAGHADADRPGLGLSIVRRILELHSSRLDVGQATDRGAALSFVLARSGIAATAGGAQAAE
jgi:signal transduction histidine kinase